MNLDDHGAYLPTPEEIEEGCRKIQAAWDEREERKHRTGSKKRTDYVTVPCVGLRHRDRDGEPYIALLGRAE